MSIDHIHVWLACQPHTLHPDSDYTLLALVAHALSLHTHALGSPSLHRPSLPALSLALFPLLVHPAPHHPALKIDWARDVILQGTGWLLILSLLSDLPQDWSLFWLSGAGGGGCQGRGHAGRVFAACVNAFEQCATFLWEMCEECCSTAKLGMTRCSGCHRWMCDECSRLGPSGRRKLCRPCSISFEL